jgi:hypothetical protein
MVCLLQVKNVFVFGVHIFISFHAPKRGLVFLSLFIDHVAEANAGASDVVDVFNATDGSWAVAKLSVPRDSLAATALPDQGLAFFAGGYGLEGAVISFGLIAACSSAGIICWW